MNDTTISTKLIELYGSIRNEDISIVDINNILDESFVFHARSNPNSLMPLIGANRKEKLDVLKFLVQHEMYSNLTKNEALVLLEKTGDSDNFLGFDYLVKTFNLDDEIDVKATFERYCSLGCMDIVNYFISPERPWKININSTSGLEYACSQERKELVEYLLKNGADISNNNYAAVTTAFTNDNLDIFNYFLFELDIDLYKMKESVSKVDFAPSEKILLEHFIQVVENAILTNNLNKNLTIKTSNKSNKI